MQLGIDIGSTTMKAVLCGEDGGILYSDYRRHNTDITGTAVAMLSDLSARFPGTDLTAAFTGSVGMGYAEAFGAAFVQEVICASEVIRQRFPEVHTLIDIGGEDSKMIFFEPGRVPDIRMNGNCAGGTGAFIDQTASLIGSTPAEIDGLARNAGTLYQIASRCGVFAKTDIQNLLSRDVSRCDIAASVLDSVARQVVTSLSRGTAVKPKVFLCGGPFAFIPELRRHMTRVLGLGEEDCIVPQRAELIPAWGAALSSTPAGKEGMRTSPEKLRDAFAGYRPDTIHVSGRLEPLFSGKEDYDAWLASEKIFRTPKGTLDPTRPGRYWLGVDSGSTTTKIVLLDSDGAIVHSDYMSNGGDSFGAFRRCLERMGEKVRNPENVTIVSGCVTGYGESLLRGTFGIEHGVVETMAHFTAAREVSPDVSFVLDIGGQDMKAIFCSNGSIRRMELNEACSSGCGSFLENFAGTLGYGIEDFARMACFARRPCDLGSRCTVFMNSKVKQAMREGAPGEDIAAGFSYSVVRNCLFKVLKLKDSAELGDNIVVQGGTFRNHSIIRALEKTVGCRVGFSDIPELMGAYGCALYAMRRSPAITERSRSLAALTLECGFETEETFCPGCDNRCKVRKMSFNNGNVYYSGNNCERHFHNKAEKASRRGTNMFEEKYRLLFGLDTDGNTAACRAGNGAPHRGTGLRIGIPRALGIYEDYPFWHTLLSSCGLSPVLSSPSTARLCDKGIRYTMSDNICFPAKLMHGHIADLAEKKVDRILYPYTVYGHKDDPRARNSYNCPVVSGYSDVLRSSMAEITAAKGIPIDSPTVNFADRGLAEASCTEYLASLGIDRKAASEALRKAFDAQERYGRRLTLRAEEILSKAVSEGRMVILLACRPYHTDPLVEHRVSGAIADMGIDVITENIATLAGSGVYGQLNAVSQWAWPNRIFKSAWFVGQHPYPGLHMVELTSFGCGPDAFILDEVSGILRRHGKNLTVLKIDDVNNIGSLRLRIRSLVESVSSTGLSCPGGKAAPCRRLVTTRRFGLSDRNRTIVVPYFAEGYSEFIPSALRAMGYDAVSLPPGTRADVETGLRYANNDICYPATIVVGSIINFLKSGRLPREKTAVIMYQTGGQCRATNYFSLIQNAMCAEGFSDVPLISISKNSGLTAGQDGFTPDWKRNFRLILYTVLYADCLSQLYHSAAVREARKGDAARLREKYTGLGRSLIERRDCRGLLDAVSRAAGEFSSIIRPGFRPPVIGIVGEIYVKYNSFSNRDVIRWLAEHGIEAAVPSVYNFFMTAFANRHIDRKEHIKRQKTPLWLTDTLYRWIRRNARAFDRACSAFPGYRPFGDPFENAGRASGIVSLAGDFGEGWLLPGEIAGLAEEGIDKVISLQPFGCIANHIISKGVERRIKELYPQMSLLFLDFDSNTSEANVYNRLHFMIQNDRQ